MTEAAARQPLNEYPEDTKMKTSFLRSASLAFLVGFFGVAHAQTDLAGDWSFEVAWEGAGKNLPKIGLARDDKLQTLPVSEAERQAILAKLKTHVKYVGKAEWQGAAGTLSQVWLVTLDDKDSIGIVMPGSVAVSASCVGKLASPNAMDGRCTSMLFKGTFRGTR